jgi:hypothetical protein
MFPGRPLFIAVDNIGGNLKDNQEKDHRDKNHGNV